MSIQVNALLELERTKGRNHVASEFQSVKAAWLEFVQRPKFWDPRYGSESLWADLIVDTALIPQTGEQNETHPSLKGKIYHWTDDREGENKTGKETFVINFEASSRGGVIRDPREGVLVYLSLFPGSHATPYKKVIYYRIDPKACRLSEKDITASWSSWLGRIEQHKHSEALSLHHGEQRQHFAPLAEAVA